MVRRLEVFTATVSLFSIAIGSLVLLRWILASIILKNWRPEIQPNGAMCFLLLGLALWVLRKEPPRPGLILNRVASYIAAASVSLVGLLSVLENLFDWGLHIDQLRYVLGAGEKVGGTRAGAIPLVAAVSFGLLGAALLALDSKRRTTPWLFQSLAGAAAVVSSLGLLDYALGQETLQTHVTLPAALTLVLLSSAILSARPQVALGGLLASPSAGARWLRRAGPISLAVLTVFGKLISKALLSEAHFVWVEVTAMAIVAGILLTALVVWSAVLLERSENQRIRAEQTSQFDPQKLTPWMDLPVDFPVEANARRWSIIGIALGMFLTASGGLAVWLSAKKAAEDSNWVAHTHAVRAALEQTLGHAIDIQSGSRGFAATGNERFLESFRLGKQVIYPDLNRLTSMSLDNSTQQRLLNELRSEIDAELMAAEDMIVIRERTNVLPSAELFVEGKTEMDTLRGSVREMLAEEDRLLSERAKAADDSRRQTGVVSLISTVLGILMLLFAGLVTGREIGHSALLRSRIQNANCNLERRVQERTEELQRSEQRVRVLLDSTAEAILGEDSEGNCVFSNSATEHLFGYQRDELLGKNLHHLIHHSLPDGKPLPAASCPIAGAAQRGETYHNDQMVLWKKDGTSFAGECWSHPMFVGGKMAGAVVTCLDISQRRALEQAMHESEEQLRLFIEHAPVSLAMFDREMRYLKVSRRWHTDYELGDRDLRGVSHYDLFPSLPDSWKEAHRRGLAGEILRKESDSFELHSGALRWLRWEIRPWYQASGKIGGIVIFTEDTTARTQAEVEILRLNNELEERVQRRTAQLEAANKELEAFTYSVSHDLRAPLRHISGFSQILMDEYGSGICSEARHYLQRIQEGTRRMGLLVDDLLNLARVGRCELDMQVTGLRSVVEEVISSLQPDFASRQVEWKVGELPFVDCDAALVKQVFQNLLSNAIKFTRPRLLAVIEIGQRQQNGVPVIFVRDNGAGFSMKYVDKLFGVFQRLHRSEDFEGTGVGLATVQRIVQKHGGCAWAEAELDKGATFYFTLGRPTEKRISATDVATAGEHI